MNTPAARKLYAIHTDFDSTVRLAVFSREVVQDTLDEFALDDGRYDASALAFALTGWHAFERGPGRAFGDDPHVVIGRRNVVVKQTIALDV